MTGRSLVVLGCLGAASCGTPRSTPLEKSDTETLLDRVASSFQRDQGLPGLSVVVMRGHHTLLAKGYGVESFDTAAPATIDTVYPVGSISKQITAAVVMRLVERGRLALDAPVTEYVPAFAVANRRAPTVRELLRQTSGIPAWDDLPESQPFLEDKPGSPMPTLVTMVEQLARQPAMYESGTWWSYSNANYTLLAHAIEQITHRSFDDVSRELIASSGLHQIGECASPRFNARAMGYERTATGNVPRPLPAAIATAFTGAGGACATTRELARWMRQLVDGRVVSRASWHAMTAPTTLPDLVAPYGFGLSLVELANTRAIWHMGVIRGYVAVLAYVPQHDLVVAAITNRRHVWLQELAKQLVHAVAGRDPAPLADERIPADELARFVATYEDHMLRFAVVAESGRLYADTPLGERARLQRQPDGTFATAPPQSFRFRFVPDRGPIRRLEWEWGEIRAFAKPVSPKP